MRDRFVFWFDLENAPDVLFFEPIAKQLTSHGHEVLITARDYSDVPTLAREYGMSADVVGVHGGKQRWKKVYVGLKRAFLLGQVVTWPSD